MLRTIGRRLTSFFRATTPDPFVLAVALTTLVLALAWVVEGTSPVAAVRAWQGDSGFWSLLAFSMQMVLILVTGHALAATRPVRAMIRGFTSLPRDGAQAAALVAFVAMATALVNWGLGLIVGALLARDMGRACARRGVKAHYPLLVAAGYAGLMCWHGGLSGTAPLKMTTAADLVSFLGADLAERVEPVGFTRTVFGLGNLVTSGGLLLLVPLACYLLAPRDADPVEAIDAFDVAPDDDTAAPPPTTWPERLGQSPFGLLLVVPPLATAVVLFFAETGVDRLEPNAINLIFLTLGLVLHGSLVAYARAIGDATRHASGIVLQFPFYAGIMGVMRATGLAATLAAGLAAVAPAKLYTVTTFLSAGLVNLFVPSGGGQWAVQGPIAVEAARDLGIPIEQAVMAVAYGDQWTNMLQPFWALPLLAITGVKAKDILGYTALFLVIGGLWMGGSLYVQAALTTP
ncbi:MAG: short-chain fatty acid transporter [Sandaracinaceae bacterium]|nr:short-chain fatty acid transporter [Sandaracinaceae bacterium]